MRPIIQPVTALESFVVCVSETEALSGIEYRVLLHIDIFTCIITPIF